MIATVRGAPATLRARPGQCMAAPTYRMSLTMRHTANLESGITLAAYC
jgi:hypothetical protein